MDSALDALAAHFGTLTGIAVVQRGWPEHPRDLDLTAGPIVTVTRVDDTPTHVPPTPLDTGPTVTWKVAELQIVAQVDLWAAYRAQRDDAGAVLEAGLHNRLPMQTGLYLTQADYHSRPLVVLASSGTSVEDGSAAEVGEWRRRWMVSIQTDLVVLVETPEQLELVLRTTANDTTEADEVLS